MRKLILFILLIFASPSWGAIYYVSSSGGNDSYTTVQAQSESTPWQTLGKVNAEFGNGTFVAGDFIKFKRGDTWTGASLTLDHALGGSSGSPITFQDYGSGALPKIYRTGDAPIMIEGGAYWITIKNLEIYSDATTYSGITIWNAHDIVVDGCTIHDCNDGVAGNNGYPDGGYLTENITIQNCTIYNCTMEGIYFKNYGTVSASSNVNNVLVYNNTIYDCDELVQFTHHGDPPTDKAPSNVTIRGNTLYNSYKYSGANVWAVFELGITGGGMLIEDNLIHDCTAGASGGAIFWLDGQGGTGDSIVIRNNVIWDITDPHGLIGLCYALGTVEIYHNTIYSVSQKGIWNDPICGTISGVVVKNNIFSTITGNPIGTTSGLTCDYNVRYTSGTSTCTGAHDQTGDPSFISIVEGSENFHLQSGSSARNNGLNVGISDDIEGTSRPQGSGYDIGAYEYVENIPKLTGVSIIGGSIQ